MTVRRALAVLTLAAALAYANGHHHPPTTTVAGCTYTGPTVPIDDAECDWTD